MAAGDRAAESGAGAPGSLARAVGVRADHRAALGGVDPAPALGAAMSRGRCRATLSGSPKRSGPERAALRVSLLIVSLLVSRAAFAGERYALVITGASGGDPYAEKYT